MALKKEIILENGIILNYHRVVSVNNITNQQSVIEVASYINEAQREKEKEWYKEPEDWEQRGDMNVLIETKCYSKDYDPNLNVDNAYEYLKTLKEFEGAEDV